VNILVIKVTERMVCSDHERQFFILHTALTIVHVICNDRVANYPVDNKIRCLTMQVNLLTVLNELL